MYQPGDKIVYSVHGVCRVVEIEVKRVDREKISYYVLEPVDQPGARYYVPSEKPAAVAKMRPILSREEMTGLLRENTSVDDHWVADENRRKQQYRELISGGRREDILAIIRLLHRHRMQQEEIGKRLHLCDETILRDCEKMLISEISVVLALSVPQALQYLHKELGIT